MRNQTLDQAKIVLSILVVMIHVEFLKDYSHAANYFFTQSIFRLVVPVFFLISGYFFFNVLLHKSRSAFINWVLGLFFLHTFWSVVYLYFYIPHNVSAFDAGLEIVKRYVEGYWHLWFTIALLCAGICLYFLKNRSTATLSIIAICLFIGGCCIQYLGNYRIFHATELEFLDFLFNKTHIYRNFLFFALPFLIMGFLIAKIKLVSKVHKPKTVAILSIAIILLCVEGILNTIFISDYKQSFDMLFSLPLVCGSLFLFLMKFDKTCKTFIYTQLSAGIYFIHPLFIMFMPNFVQSKIMELIYVCAFSLVASFFLVALNKKIKFIL